MSKDYIMRNGKRIEVEDITPTSKRKSFQVEFTQVPAYWTKALRGASGCTYQLALAILDADFIKKQKHRGGNIVLSLEVTGLSSTCRHRATQALLTLGLIEVERSMGKRAAQVTKLLHARKRPSTWPLTANRSYSS
jgi:hypothetical protein